MTAMNHSLAAIALLFAAIPSVARSAEPDAKSDIPTPKFERQVIDAKIQIGYGLAIGDVDGDGKPDILLADKKQIVWYRNPDWKRFVMAEDLTPQDNVCIAARDIDGSGKVSVAVGAGWNPSETTDPTKSGGVFYLIRPKDPTQHWEPVRLHHEVTTHRMQWVRTSKDIFQLVVVPLHGLGNKNGEGNGVRILAYDIPKDPHDQWTTHVIDDSMHMTHNFELWWNQHAEMEQLLIAGREGINASFSGATFGGFRARRSTQVVFNRQTNGGAGEVRLCSLATDVGHTTIEPMHGNQVVYYAAKNDLEPDPFSEKPGGRSDVKPIESNWSRHLLDDTLAEGHALGCTDFLGLKRQQIVAGWRAPNKDKKVGIKLYIPLDDKGEKWQAHVVDDNQMACEDLKIADLDGDGQPDIIASGRATHNLVIYWNRTKAK
jgi:hypothetical protein